MECEINLEKLQIVVNQLFDHIIKTRHVNSIKLASNQNYYWQIEPEKLYDISVKPSEFTVGSLADDWDFVSSLLDKNSDPVAYQLTEVAPLLNYIGEALSKELAKHGG